VAEVELMQRVQMSRKVALKVFKERLSRLIIEQYMTLAGEVLTVGKTGKRKSYSPAILKDPSTYTINCELMTTNKREELANLSMFVAAYDRLPLKYNLTNILMAEDPDGIIRQLDIEQARKADPVIALTDMARRYAQEAAETEDETEADALKMQSKMLTERAKAIIRQRQAPGTLPEKAQVPQIEQPRSAGNLLPALMGGQQIAPARRRRTEEEEM
jgi:hypothetical protein